MKYMLLIYHEEKGWNSHTEAERQEIYRQYRALIEELHRRRQIPDWRSVAADHDGQQCPCAGE